MSDPKCMITFPFTIHFKEVLCVTVLKVLVGFVFFILNICKHMLISE